MIDILSGGRVVCGFVRGLGQESLATNANPAYNRERFDEAHDVIVKAWTTPGPFHWVGRHYEYRVVNPWMRPLQKPHPPIWIPGVVSPESVRWAPIVLLRRAPRSSGAHHDPRDVAEAHTVERAS